MTLLAIKKIVLDEATQMRASLSQAVIDEYSQMYLDSVTMPSIVVFKDGDRYHLADGWHRLKAQIKAGFLDVDADIRSGGKDAAIKFAWGANSGHGLNRTNSDKRKAVLSCMAHKDSASLSARAIAKLCGVSGTFVDNIKAESNPVAKKEVINEVVTELPANVCTPESVDDHVDAFSECQEKYDPRDDEIAEWKDAIKMLSDENEILRYKAGCSILDATEAEKASVYNELLSLKSRIAEIEAEFEKKDSMAKVEIAAITLSRDTYMRENAEMKIQLKDQRNQIKKLLQKADEKDAPVNIDINDDRLGFSGLSYDYTDDER